MLISSAFYQTAQTPAKPDCSETAVSLSTALCYTSLCRQNLQRLTNITVSRDFPQKCVWGVCSAHLGWFTSTLFLFCECMSLYCVGWIRLTVAWSLPLLFMARNRLLKTPRIPITPWDTAKSSSTPTDWEKHIDCSDDLYVLKVKGQTIAMFTQQENIVVIPVWSDTYCSVHAQFGYNYEREWQTHSMTKVPPFNSQVS